MKTLRKILFPLIWLKERLDPDYWANRIGEKTGLYDKARVYGEKEKPWYVKLALIIIIILLILFMSKIQADDNHVHIDQVSGGDNLSIDIEQVGYGNLVKFSTAHSNNTFNFSQKGNNNTISWVPWWGSGESWGGDVDGTGNEITVEQFTNNSYYGAHVWGNNNTVTIYQDGDGEHETYLDIHASSTDTNVDQEGSGDMYGRVYYYGSSSDSTVDLNQYGAGNHTATITLQGTQETDLTLTQQGSTNQSYSLTQNCVTSSGCSITVTQD